MQHAAIDRRHVVECTLSDQSPLRKAGSGGEAVECYKGFFLSTSPGGASMGTVVHDTTTLSHLCAPFFSVRLFAR